MYVATVKSQSRDKAFINYLLPESAYECQELLLFVAVVNPLDPYVYTFKFSIFYGYVLKLIVCMKCIHGFCL